MAFKDEIKGYCKKRIGVKGKPVILVSFRDGFVPDDDNFVYVLLPVDVKNKPPLSFGERSDYLIIERERRESTS